MKKILIFLMLSLILINGCSKPKIVEEKTVSYTIPEEDSVRTFTYEEDNPDA